jgi:hypothetical protein
LIEIGVVEDSIVDDEMTIESSWRDGQETTGTWKKKST